MSVTVRGDVKLSPLRIELLQEANPNIEIKSVTGDGKIFIIQYSRHGINFEKSCKAEDIFYPIHSEKEKLSQKTSDPLFCKSCHAPMMPAEKHCEYCGVWYE